MKFYYDGRSEANSVIILQQKDGGFKGHKKTLGDVDELFEQMVPICHQNISFFYRNNNTSPLLTCTAHGPTHSSVFKYVPEDISALQWTGHQ